MAVAKWVKGLVADKGRGEVGWEWGISNKGPFSLSKMGNEWRGF